MSDEIGSNRLAMLATEIRGAQASVEAVTRGEARWTRALVYLTGVLAIATVALVIAAGFQYWAMRGQLAVMRGQLDEMKAEQRPWVYPDILVGNRIGEDKGTYYVPLTLQYHNTGHEPALFVIPKAKAEIIDVGFRLPGKNDVCDEYRGKSLNDTDQGMAVFPDEKNRGDMVNVELAKSEWINAVKENRAVAILITGCIDYRSSPDSTNHHQTRFWLVVGTRSPSGGVAKLPNDPTTIDIGVNVAKQVAD